MMSSKHLSDEMLLDLADRQLRPEDDIARHLSDCSACTKELQRLEHLVNLMREDQSVDAPRDLLAYAVNLFHQRRAESGPSLVKRIVAALSFDSGERAPAFGVRSGLDAGRQLLYTAGDNDIDLRLNEQEHNRWALAGQVLGENCAGGEMLLQGADLSASAALNEQCEFSLSGLPPGNYQLLLRLPYLEVKFPQLEIGV